MKKASHQLSRFRPPAVRGRGTYSIDYNEDFWKDLLHKVTGINRVLNWAVVVLLVLALFPRPTHIVYADPIIPISQSEAIKPLQTIKDPSYKPVDTLESILHPVAAFGSHPNTYGPGQCTDGVASRLGVPNGWGNANQWPASAQSAGYEVSPIPKLGAIAVSYTDSYMGHVAIVTSVAPLRIWEMNYAGPYSTNERLANNGEFTSFIYF